MTPEPVSETWKNRAGDYVVLNAAPGDAPTIEKMSISVEDSFVVLRYGFSPEMSFGQNASVALNLVNDNEAFVLGYGRGGGESVIFGPDGRSFSYMGLKFVKI